MPPRRLPGLRSDGDDVDGEAGDGGQGPGLRVAAGGGAGGDWDARGSGGGHRVGFGIFLTRHSRARVTTAMTAVIQSVTAWRVRTTTAPHRAPPAAAVAPVTKALIWALSRWRMNQRPG